MPTVETTLEKVGFGYNTTSLNLNLWHNMFVLRIPDTHRLVTTLAERGYLKAASRSLHGGDPGGRFFGVRNKR